MARHFGATTDVINCGSITMPTILSVTAWVKAPSANSENYIFQFSLYGGFYLLAAHHQEIDFDGTTPSGAWQCSDAESALTWTNWNHLAFTYDSTGANIPIYYANGVSDQPPTVPSEFLTQTVARTATLGTSSNTIRIGNWSGDDRSWGGDIGYVNLHNVILTPTEIVDSMNNGSVSRGRIGGWSLAGSSLADDSGNGHTGTATGTTVVADPPGVTPLSTNNPTRPKISSNSILRSYT